MSLFKSFSFILLALCLTSCSQPSSRVNDGASPSSGSSRSSSNQDSKAAQASSSESKASASQESGSASSQSGSDRPPQVSSSPEPASEGKKDQPYKKQLAVPPQVQRAWNTCAPTSVSMILAYRGQTVSQEELAREMGTDETFGTHNRAAIQVLNQHLFGNPQPAPGQAGYRLATVSSSAPSSQDMQLFKERLRQDIDDGYPLYLTVDNAVLYPGRSGEHNVVGIGYELTADGQDLAAVYYLDPSYLAQDAQFGGLKKVSPEEVLRAMVVCQEPNYAW